MDQLPVIDSHVHFWNPEALSYPWLDAAPALQRAFLPADYTPLTSGAVSGVVVVEADCAPADSMKEAEFFESLAAAEPRIIGAVVHVDLFDEGHRAAALDRLAGMDRVVGVRQNIQGHPSAICHDPAFVRGVQEVGRFGLTFDLCATADQLTDVATLVARCPGTRFVLDHCGKPAIRDDRFAPWAADLARIAARGDVYCKLSGLLTEAQPDQRTDEALRPWAEEVLAAFGPSRLMYGSDWPVVTLAGSAERWRAFTDRFTATWGAAYRRRFYADNAIHFYGLRVHAES